MGIWLGETVDLGDCCLPNPNKWAPPKSERFLDQNFGAETVGAILSRFGQRANPHQFGWHIWEIISRH